jgi:hypothetical protein
MKKIRSVFLAVCVCVSASRSGSAQALTPQRARLAVAEFILKNSQNVWYLRGRRHLLDSRPLAIRFNARLIRDSAEGPSVAETQELGARLGGGVASASTGAQCRNMCGDTTSARVRMGPPTMIGDSAAVVYSVSYVVGRGENQRPITDRYVAWLSHGATGWHVSSFAGANGLNVSEPHVVPQEE